MKKPSWKTLVITIVLLFTFITGCGEKEPPSVRQSRAIAAENVELRKELDRQDARFDNLKKKYDSEVEKVLDQLEKCQKERDEWKAQAKDNVRDQVQSVLESVMDDNERLRKENARLKSKLEKLEN